MDEYDTRKKKKKRRYFIVHTATINTRQGKRYLIKFYFLYNFYILNIILKHKRKIGWKPIRTTSLISP